MSEIQRVDPSISVATGGKVEAPAAVPTNGDSRLVQRKLQRRALQRRAGGGARSEPEAVHEAANHATSGAGGGLPHGDAIQRSFGKHDVSGIVAHTDEKAAQGAERMGAEAFASGNHVAFAGAPSLHTAAHEAAHVVQQRGGVQLKGGVGEAGDGYERHADAVADAVVAGRSAEPLLDRGVEGGAPGHATVQRKIKLGGEEFDPEVTHIQASWGFTEKEKELYLEWLRDEAEHEYPSREKLVEAIRNQSVVAKLTTKRNLDLKTLRGREGSEEQGLDGDLEQQLHLLAGKSQEVAATITIGTNIFQKKSKLLGDKSGLNMVHTAEFQTDNKNARYIRFVKSARLNGGDLSVTIPGYVTYGKSEKVDPQLIKSAKQTKPVDPSARGQLKSLVTAKMSKAAWSLDGPHREWEPSKLGDKKLTNVDTPGLESSYAGNFPYILITHFIGVLFDPVAGKVLTVLKYDDDLAEFGENFEQMKKEEVAEKQQAQQNGKKGGANPYI